LIQIIKYIGMNIGLTYYFLIAMTFVFVCPYVTTEKSIMSKLFNNVLVIIPSKHANDLNSNSGIKKKSKSINDINLLNTVPHMHTSLLVILD
jgi:hypothetical protein